MRPSAEAKGDEATRSSSTGCRCRNSLAGWAMRT